MAKRRDDGGGAATTARLLIFSGRPDPQWSVGGGELSELLGLVKGVLGREESNRPPQGGLGYRGFLVSQLPVDERPTDIEVFRGVVTEKAGPRTRHWRDTGGIERWLLRQARSRGHGATLDSEGVNETPEGRS